MPELLGVASLQAQSAEVVRQILEYEETVVAKVRSGNSTGTTFECRVCLSLQKDRRNMVCHLLSNHKFGNEEIVNQLEAFVAPYYQKLASHQYICKLCRKVLRGISFARLLVHFLFIHIENQ